MRVGIELELGQQGDVAKRKVRGTERKEQSRLIRLISTAARRGCRSLPKHSRRMVLLKHEGDDDNYRSIRRRPLNTVRSFFYYSSKSCA